VAWVLLVACSSATRDAAAPGAGAGAAGEQTAGGHRAAAGNVPSGGESSGGGSAPTACDAGGPVALDGVTNARRVGCMAAADGRTIDAGLLLRAGHLGGLSDCDQLSALGVRTVIDLRDLEHPDYVPDAPCVEATTRFVAADLPRLLPPSAATYLDTLVAAEPKLALIFSTLAEPQSFPALLHCVIGRDRASLITGLVLLSAGIPRDQVLADMVTNQDDGIVIDPSWMDGVFERIDGEGGVETYLTGHGVSAADLSSIRTQLLGP